nr:hypothetical protein [Tanacetum cinerariifolium]
KSRNKHTLTAVNTRNKRTPLAEPNGPIWPLTKQTPLFDASTAMVEVVVLVVLLEAVGVVLGGGGGSEVHRRRVRESDMMGRIDRVTRSLFGFAGKISPEKFFDGGSVAAVVAGRRWATAGGERVKC